MKAILAAQANLIADLRRRVAVLEAKQAALESLERSQADPIHTLQAAKGGL